MNITTAPSTGTNPADQLPDTFDLDELKATFSEAEIKAMASGDDPMVKLPDPEQAEPKAETLGDQDAAAVAAAQAAATQAAATQQEAAPVIPDDDRAPTLDVPDTAAADAIIKEADAKLEALQQKYDDGDLSKAEWTAQLKALTSQQAKAQADIDRAAEAIEEIKAVANERWTGQINKFLAAGNEALVTPEHYAGFDAQLKAVTGNPANAGMSYSKMISLAAKQYGVAYEARTGKALDLKTPVQAKTEPTVQKPQQEKRPDGPQLLGNLNGDGGLSVDDGTFSAIDRVAATDPFEAERMMGKLSPAGLDAYLRGG